MADARLDSEKSWQLLRQKGYDVRLGSDGRVQIPQRMPRFDDPLDHQSFFRTRLCDESLDGLSLPRTYFGRSEIRDVSFQNSDLSESSMCWNDFLECNFANADLHGCDLRASVWRSCSFHQSDLRGADLRHASFKDCVLDLARLDGALLGRSQQHRLELSNNQKAQINWQVDEGPEPDGG